MGGGCSIAVPLSRQGRVDERSGIDHEVLPVYLKLNRERIVMGVSPTAFGSGRGAANGEKESRTGEGVMSEAGVGGAP